MPPQSLAEIEGQLALTNPALLLCLRLVDSGNGAQLTADEAEELASFFLLLFINELGPDWEPNELGEAYDRCIRETMNQYIKGNE